MLYAIKAFSVLLCIALAGDGHLQHSTSPSESQFIVPLQILIIIRVILGVALLSFVLKMYKSNKALAVSLKHSRDSSLYPTLKQNPEPAVSEILTLRAQKAKDEVKQKLSTLGALGKDRLSYRTLPAYPNNAQICLTTSTTYYAYLSSKDAMEDPLTNILSDGEITEANVVTNLRPSPQLLHSSPSVLLSDSNELIPVGNKDSTSQQWDTGCVAETVNLCAEGEALSSVTRPDSPLVGAIGEAIVVNSEADTTSSFVNSSSTHELDSLCDSNIASMLSRYFKDEPSPNVARVEQPLEDWLCEESHSQLLPPAADINAQAKQDFSSKGPIMHPYSSVSTMIGLGIRGLRPLGRKGDKPFRYLSSNHIAKTPESRVFAFSKGPQKATTKLSRNNQKAFANKENTDIEYVE